jgi:hypothetical protein
MEDDLAVRVGLELCGVLELFPECAVVVDLAVDGEDELVVLGSDGLGASVLSGIRGGQ